MQKLRSAQMVTLAAAILTLSPGARIVRGQGATEGNVFLGGNCPVSYQTQSKAVKGDPAHAVRFQGRTFHCADAEAKKLFEADPSKYVPQYGGLCTTALGGMYGNRFPGDPEVFYVIEGKLYLFSSLRARNAFDTDTRAFLNKADVLYEAPSNGGFCLVSYQLENKAVKGDPKYKRVHNGLVFHFAGQQAADAFEKEPSRFLPKYDGFCAEGVSRGKRYPGEPKVFSIIEGKTFLFFDAKAKQLFEADAKALTAKADADWQAAPGPAKTKH